MTKTITIDPVTRIEGHAKITLHLDGDGHVADARFHVTEFRGFEKFCEGRLLWEMPGITSRICGICPSSHLITSAIPYINGIKHLGNLVGSQLPADLFGPADLARLASVDEPAFAPDGKSIVYTVTVTSVAEDKQQSDLWRVGYDGGEARVLTQLVVYPGEHHGLEVPSYLQDRLERLLGWNVR